MTSTNSPPGPLSWQERGNKKTRPFSFQEKGPGDEFVRSGLVAPAFRRVPIREDRPSRKDGEVENIA